MSVTRKARERARELWKGCADVHCPLRQPRGGMGTNGGCRCRERLAEALDEFHVEGGLAAANEVDRLKALDWRGRGGR